MGISLIHLIVSPRISRFTITSWCTENNKLVKINNYINIIMNKYNEQITI